MRAWPISVHFYQRLFSMYQMTISFRLPEQNEIEHNLRRFPMRTRTEKQHRKLIEQIREIMDPDGRRYLTVFRINSELNLKQTICHAIFKGKIHFSV